MEVADTRRWHPHCPCDDIMAGCFNSQSWHVWESVCIALLVVGAVFPPLPVWKYCLKWLVVYVRPITRKCCRNYEIEDEPGRA